MSLKKIGPIHSCMSRAMIENPRNAVKGTSDGFHGPAHAYPVLPKNPAYIHNSFGSSGLAIIVR